MNRMQSGHGLLDIRSWVLVTGLVLALLVADAASAQQYSISTVAGKGREGYSGDGGAAASADLSEPFGLAVDPAGNLFVADYANCRVRKISGRGVITTVAGNGNSLGNIGDGGEASHAQIWTPQGVSLDSAGNLFIADNSNHRVRKVSPDGIITTVAGNGSLGYSGDGGPAVNAQLAGPSGVAVDRAGNLFIADSSDHRLRKVSPGGVITTMAGAGSAGYSGDNGPATRAQLDSPAGVAVDSAGNVFIADTGNNRIRKISPGGIITTIAGSGNDDYSGDGGPATGAQLRSPFGVAVDSAGNVFIADSHNNRIRKVSGDGIITTAAGSGPVGSPGGYTGDGGSATNAQLCGPRGVAVDTAGNVYVSEFCNDTIRVLRPPSQPQPQPPPPKYIYR